MRTDPATSLAENLRQRGIPAWSSTCTDGRRVRVEGAIGAPSCGFNVHCHPFGGYLTDRGIQLGTAADPAATADLIVSLYGMPPYSRTAARGR
jgi:hypothetical protein